MPPAPPAAPLPAGWALVGPGRVGRSLAVWLAGHPPAVVGVRGEAGRRWADGRGLPGAPWQQVASAGRDLLLLAVPTPALGEVAAALAARPQARVALHTAGACGAEALAPLRAAGCAIGSLHPLLAFPAPLPAAAAEGAFFAVDGDPAAVALAQGLVAGWGGVAGLVPAASRPLYHLAASLAAGGAATVTAAAVGILQDLALPAAAAHGVLGLARGALAAQDPEHPGRALTGPAARGEAGLLDQLDELGRHDRELHPLVVRLALETLRRVAAEESLDAAQRRLRDELRKLVEGPDRGR